MNSGKYSRAKMPSGSGSEAGAALIIVLLMLVIMTFLGLMSLYTSQYERVLDSAFRSKTYARQSAEAGVGLTAQKIMNRMAADLTPIPGPEIVAGTVFGTRATHPVVGNCYILRPNCIDVRTDLPFNPGEMCCFRTGRAFDANYELNKIAAPIPGPRKIDIPGSSEYQNAVYNFFVTGGGPSRSLSEYEVMIEIGPVRKGGGSGTMYGSTTGIN